MAPRCSPRPAAAVLLTLLLLGAGCAGTPEPPAPAVAAAPGSAPGTATPGEGAVAIALRSAGEPLPDVVGDTVDDARRTLGARGVRTRVVAFDADAAVTAQSPRGGEAPPADATITLWQGTPPDLPPSAPPPSPAAAATAPPAVAEAPPPVDPPTPGDVASPEAPAALTDAAAAAAADTTDTAVPPAPVAAPAPIPVPAPVAAPAPSAPVPGAPPTGRVLEGPATWYGPGFVGNRTACGGRFDPGELTMASRELACGTRAHVTGPSGRSVEVTVTDWGPAEWTGKRFDLSAAAFAEIAALSAGAVHVRVEVLR